MAKTSSVSHCLHKTKSRCLARSGQVFLPSEDDCEGEMHNFTEKHTLHFNTTVVNGCWLLNISLKMI